MKEKKPQRSDRLNRNGKFDTSLNCAKSTTQALNDALNEQKGKKTIQNGEIKSHC